MICLGQYYYLLFTLFIYFAYAYTHSLYRFLRDYSGSYI